MQIKTAPCELRYFIANHVAIEDRTYIGSKLTRIHNNKYRKLKIKQTIKIIQLIFECIVPASISQLKKKKRRKEIGPMLAEQSFCFYCKINLLVSIFICSNRQGALKNSFHYLEHFFHSIKHIALEIYLRQGLPNFVNRV